MVDAPKLTDAEWTVMQAVWRHSPASARDVLERVAPMTGWAYTTVRTLLERLVDKGALEVRLQANRSLYAPRLQPAAARSSALRSLLAAAFDGSFGGLLQHLFAEERLSARDRARLQELLRDAETPDRAAADTAARPAADRGRRGRRA